MPQKSLSLIRLILKFGLPVLFIIMGFIVIKKMSVKKNPPPSDRSKKVPVVDVIKIKREDISLDIEGYGTVRAQKEIDVISELQGEVTFINKAFVKGGFLKKDDILLELDQEEYTDKLNAAVADVNIARANIEELKQKESYMKDMMKLMKQKLKLAETEYNRQKLSRKKGHISAQQLEKAQTAYIQSQQQYKDMKNAAANIPIQIKKAKASLVKSETSLAKAQRNMTLLKIRAPFSAQVTVKKVEKGQWIKPGVVLGRLAYDRVYEVPVMVDQRELSKLPNVPLEFMPEYLDDFNKQQTNIPVNVQWVRDKVGYIWKGRLARIEPIDPQTRTVPLIAEVERPWHSMKDGTYPLLTGFYCKVTIPGYRSKNGLIKIPVESLRENDAIFLLQNNALSIVKVRVVHYFTDEIVILPTDKAVELENEFLITSNIQYPIPGMHLSMRSDEKQPEQEKEFSDKKKGKRKKGKKKKGQKKRGQKKRNSEEE
ncbi:MAG: RND family efflux transporter MFP subunit [Candidatus Magnetoglobus multicellularis str. Araruama]|uniref:RND family efflux transporter MFP subunit n=1 Tax=Candidatus Magnetoglobus multicellularis str. Araruama TaxID=890399 RepID=A0A1V1PBK3_9BACT|nr:MAG: RND family efflux transporter MFP subunit [Candidatus Magnetoglobus multicellularis str. Araruama]